MDRPEDVIKKIRINRMDTFAFSGLLLRVGYLSGYLLYVLLHLVILMIFLNFYLPALDLCRHCC
jgi:hypothetical protein